MTARSGSYFTVSPNGLDALAAIDALAVAAAEGFPTRRNVMRNSAGAVLGDLPLGTPLADGTPALTMKRSRFAVRTGRRGAPARDPDRSRPAARRRRASGRHGRGALRGRHDRGGRSPRRGGRRPFRWSVGSSTRRRRRGRYVGLTNFGGVTSRRGCARRDDPAGVVAVHLRAQGVLRGAPGAERRHRVVRQRPARRDQPVRARIDVSSRRGRRGWRACSTVTSDRRPRSSAPAGSSSRATTPTTSVTCRSGTGTG